MGFGLDFVESVKGEMCGGEGIVGAEAVDSPVKTLDFASREVAGVDDPGEIIALGPEHLGLFRLVGWALMVA